MMQLILHQRSASNINVLMMNMY